MQWDAVSIATIITAFGGLRGLEAIVSAAWRGWTGRGQKKRDDLAKAFAYGDREARKRRIVEAYAASLQRRLIAAECVDESTIPPWPSYGVDTGEVKTKKEES